MNYSISWHITLFAPTSRIHLLLPPPLIITKWTALTLAVLQYPAACVAPVCNAPAYVYFPKLDSSGDPSRLHLPSLSVGNRLLCIENIHWKPPLRPSQKMDHYLRQTDKQTDRQAARPGAVLEYVNGERDLGRQGWHWNAAAGVKMKYGLQERLRVRGKWAPVDLWRRRTLMWAAFSICPSLRLSLSLPASWRVSGCPRLMNRTGFGRLSGPGGVALRLACRASAGLLYV